MRTAFLAFSVLAFASPAVADAIGPPVPIECPPGAIATTNHCGTVCVIDACTTDADCDPGTSCGARALCTEEVPCGGYGATYTIVHGACATSACAEGACASVSACAIDEVVPGTDAGTDRRHEMYGCACGCHAAPDPHGGLALAAIFGLVTLRALRSRRRR